MFRGKRITIKIIKTTGCPKKEQSNDLKLRCFFWDTLYNFSLQVTSYFLSLTSEAHSEAWTPVLLLLFTQLEKLDQERLRKFAGQHYYRVSPKTFPPRNLAVFEKLLGILDIASLNTGSLLCIT